MDYVVCVGTCVGYEGAPALTQLAEEVMKAAKERQMVPYGGVHLMVYPEQDDRVGWIACQTMVRGVS
jgi:hypothetical protein